MSEKTIRIQTRSLAPGPDKTTRDFYRAGIKHTSEWTVHEVTAEQLEALEGEPMVEVKEAKEVDEITSKGLRAQDSIEMILKIDTVEAVKAFITDEDRKTVLEAADARIAELEAEE